MPVQKLSFTAELAEPHSASNAPLKLKVLIKSEEALPILVDISCLKAYLHLKESAVATTYLDSPYQVLFRQTNRIIKLQPQQEYALILESHVIGDHLDHYPGWEEAWSSHTPGTYDLTLCYEPWRVEPFGEEYRGPKMTKGGVYPVVSEFDVKMR